MNLVMRWNILPHFFHTTLFLTLLRLVIAMDEKGFQRDAPKYWCYKCASPKKNEEPTMLSAMDQLLKLRKTLYPYDAVVDDCHQPFNLSKLYKQKCLYPWCYSITFSDGKGFPLTIRDCAENMVAVANLQPICEKQHSTLDISDCICSSDFGICSNSAASEPLVFSLSLFTTTSILLFLAIS